MRRTQLALSQILLALIVTRGAAEPAAEQIYELEARICETPARSVDLAAAAQAAAIGPLPALTPSPVVPGSTKFKAAEARFIALSQSDERSLGEFVRTQQQLPASAQLFRGVVRTLTADQQPVTLKAIAFTGEPLRFNAKQDRFEGHVSVGFVNVIAGPAPRLFTATPFQVLGEGSATPATILVDHVGPPYAQVAVVAQGLLCPLDVKATSAVASEGVTLRLAGTPSLRLQATPMRIQGFGLQSAQLSFELVGPRHGVPGDVRLSSSLGRLNGSSFQLLPGHATATLRSQYFGAATVTVSGPGIPPEKLQIEFEIPWALLLAGLLGGLLGSLLYRRSKLTRGQAATSVLLGALITVGYVWGMERVPLELPAPVGEVVVALVAILAAYHAIKLYVRLMRTRPQRPSWYP